MNSQNKAVLLLNLGSPDSTQVSDVRRYLKEFLSDERVLDAPALIRWFVLNFTILPFRPKKSAEAYKQVWQKDGSPLILLGKKLQELVQSQVDIPVALAMRYGNPSTADVIKQLKASGVSELLVVPLYPHYAMSSYETAVVRVMEEIKSQEAGIKTTLVQPFYRDEDYIDALVASAVPYLEKDYDKLLFSFHGIPERHLRKSDPSHAHCLTTPDCCNTCNPAHATCYKHQCLQTVKAFVAKAGIPQDKYSVSFQSRLGRDPWLKPYTDYVLADLPKEGVKKLLVICPAFVADCLETIEEIAVEGKEIFMHAGGEWFEQIPCLNAHPEWVDCLSRRIRDWTKSSGQELPLHGVLAKDV